MLAFRYRKIGYNVGFVLLLLSAITFTVCFATPYWFEYKSGHDVLPPGHHGLWKYCTATSCFKITEEATMSAQGLCTICLICLYVACLTAFLVSFCSQIISSRTRLPELLAAFGGLMGLVGTMVFMGNKYDDVHSEDIEAKFSWTFVLVIMSEVLALISSPVLAFFNKFIPAKRPYFMWHDNGVLILGPSSRAVVEGSQGTRSFGFPASEKEVYTISR